MSSATKADMVGDCDSFDRVKLGDTCESILKDSGVSVAELNYVCISVVENENTPSNPDNGIA
ncbi:hypothetical protein C7999DRAFT_28974 [Corynascus novoguineensis]|uniref:Uncharacterized protein n=1 Tax=Corynascus novoguineensis TaxID=1126955 RepID=A0AAN7CYU8_9PEZI|nr:hypothetical protein C7999DRAFT_28974 [Corynascus novoguineensis]